MAISLLGNEEINDIFKNRIELEQKLHNNKNEMRNLNSDSLKLDKKIKESQEQLHIFEQKLNEIQLIKLRTILKLYDSILVKADQIYIQKEGRFPENLNAITYFSKD